MPDYENVQLTIDLRTGVGTGHAWLNGDGLVTSLALMDAYGPRYFGLVAELEHRDGPPKTAAELGVDVPLAETDGVRHASITFFDTDGETAAETPRFTTNLYGRYDASYAHLVGGSRPRTKIPIGGGHYKSILNGLVYQPADTCTLFFRGDRERLERLFERNFAALWKKRGVGFGAVNDWRWDTLGADLSVVRGGRAMRPLPTEKLTAWSDSATLSWRAPYHARENHTECAPPGAEVEPAW